MFKACGMPTITKVRESLVDEHASTFVNTSHALGAGLVQDESPRLAWRAKTTKTPCLQCNVYTT